jgi:hypothetical protein
MQISRYLPTRGPVCDGETEPSSFRRLHYMP